MCRCRRNARRRAQPALTRRPGSPRLRGRARPKARLRTRRSNSAAAPMALAGDKICSLVRRRIKRRAVQRAAALRAHKNNMHPGQNAAPGGATAQPQRCALTKKTCTSHPLPKITPPFTRRSSMYILLSAHNPWFTPPSCTVSVYTVNSNSVPLSGSSAEHTLSGLDSVHISKSVLF